MGRFCDLEFGFVDFFFEGVFRNGWNNGSIIRKKFVIFYRNDFEG